MFYKGDTVRCHVGYNDSYISGFVVGKLGYDYYSVRDFKDLYFEGVNLELYSKGNINVIDTIVLSKVLMVEKKRDSFS